MLGNRTTSSASERGVGSRLRAATVVRGSICLILAVGYAWSYWTFKHASRHFVLEARLARMAARALPCDLDLSATGNAAEVKSVGWSYPEDWGTWTDGKEVFVSVRFTGDHGGETFAVALDLVHISVGAPEHRHWPTVRVQANGASVAKWRLDSFPPLTLQFHANLPLDDPRLLIRLQIDSALSPAAAGLSTDARQLGIGVGHIRISSTKSAATAWLQHDPVSVAARE